ncbi:MAG TPA: class II glutamine amidotransferase [Solirubrobacteraceae bacterium]
MCRLFGMSGGPHRVRATLWLLEAPDSLASQSRRNPDGTGLGHYDEDSRPHVDKQPIAAYEDQRFAAEARRVSSRAFVAHVRYASGTPVTLENTHPFLMDGRLFAHNGVLQGLPELESELGDAISFVHGQTDSERYFALITREIARTGDVVEGVAAAVGWIADHLPVFALNFVLITDSDLFALRYPDTHELYVLERDADRGRLQHSSARHRIRVDCDDLADKRSVVVASEEMDSDPAWRALDSGELVHVGPELGVTSVTAIDRPPLHQLTLADLEPAAASSQAPLSSRP